MAQTGKMQTYQDAIEAMLHRSVILPPELLTEIESFIEERFCPKQGCLIWVVHFGLVRMQSD